LASISTPYFNLVFSFKQFGARKRIESKNETMEVQARYFDQVFVTLFFTCKIKKYSFQNF